MSMKTRVRRGQGAAQYDVVIDDGSKYQDEVISSFDLKSDGEVDVYMGVLPTDDEMSLAKQLKPGGKTAESRLLDELKRVSDTDPASKEFFQALKEEAGGDPQKMTASSSPAPTACLMIRRAPSRNRVVWAPVNEVSVWMLA